eukprot:UN25407
MIGIEAEKYHQAPEIFLGLDYMGYNCPWKHGLQRFYGGPIRKFQCKGMGSSKCCTRSGHKIEIHANDYYGCVSCDYFICQECSQFNYEKYIKNAPKSQLWHCKNCANHHISKQRFMCDDCSTVNHTLWIEEIWSKLPDYYCITDFEATCWISGNKYGKDRSIYYVTLLFKGKKETAVKYLDQFNHTEDKN